MSKPKINTSSSTKALINVSITSPKGSLIAEINNLRKELKDYKQLKKQVSINNLQKPTKEPCQYHTQSQSYKNQQNNNNISVSNLSKTAIKSPSNNERSLFLGRQNQQQSIMSKSAKDKFFKSSQQDHSNPAQNKNADFQFQQEQHSFETKEKSLNSKSVKGINRNLFSNQKKQIKQPTNDQQEQKGEIRLQQITVREKDRKLKFDIQLNKLRKVILKLGPVEISQQVNCIINLINLVLKQYTSKIILLQKNQKISQTDQDLLIKRQQMEIQQLNKTIDDLTEQNKRLSRQFAQFKEKNHQETLQTENVNQRLDQLRKKLESSQQALFELQQKAIQLQQENRILEIKLMKKQQQLLLLDQDINYLRLQTQTSKQQKTQFNNLYEQAMTQLRQFKRNKNMEIEKLLSQKQKWEKQCKLRRNQNQTISQIEEQKITLLKELAQMRTLVSLKSAQLEEKKSIMHQNQKRVILLESDLYKLKSELQSTKNQKEFAEFQNQKLRQEIQSIKKYGVSTNSKNHSNGNNNKNNQRKNSLNLSTGNNINSEINIQKQFSRSKSKERMGSVSLEKSPNLSNNKAQRLFGEKDGLSLTMNEQTAQIENNNLSNNNENINYHAKNISLNHCQPQQYGAEQYNIENSFQERKLHYTRKLKDKEEKLKALDDIHSLIKKHRNEMQI